MNIRKSISRRKFLWKFLILGIFSTIIPIKAFANRARSNGENYIAYSLQGIIKNKHSATIIGQEYLGVRPQEASRTLLVKLICDTDKNFHALLNGENAVFRKFIIDRIRDDFARGSTVKLKGWVLSQTEARLCALSAIL